MPRPTVSHKNGCDGELKPVPCGTTHIHKCDCGIRVLFQRRTCGCLRCEEIAARTDHLMPTFGKSRYAATNETGRRLERLEDADGAVEELREAAESLVA